MGDKSTLIYYSKNGTKELFEKYTIDSNANITNSSSGQVLKYKTTKTVLKDGSFREDCMYSIQRNDGGSKGILVSRAVLSTFVGPPPTPSHTADHVDRNPLNNSLENLRWATLSEQNINRAIPEIYNNAFVIVKDGIEHTAKEWANILKLKYKTITEYALKNKRGFSYKKYNDLPGEIWRKIQGSENNNGHWELSNMKRAKYKNSAGNFKVYDKFSKKNGYPIITIKGKNMYLHRVMLNTFLPNEYSKLRNDLVVLHKDDDKDNWSIDNLEVGTRTQNAKDAHINGRFNGTGAERKTVKSYINDVLEREFESIKSAEEYLRSIGYSKAVRRNITYGIRTGKVRYDRVWSFA